MRKIEVEMTVQIHNQNLNPKILVMSAGSFKQYDFNKGITIGRSYPEGEVDLDLLYDFVSNVHGYFDYDQYGPFYLDNYSSNGTYYNGRKIKPNVKVYLNPGDVLKIQENNSIDKYESVCLVYTTDYLHSFETKTINLTNFFSEITVGRKKGNDIIINNAGVSASHASFFLAEKGWAVVDHESVNGVFVNNSRLQQPKYLKPGDCIRITNTNFVFTGDAIFYQSLNEIRPLTDGASLDIHIVERSVKQKSEKMLLLQNINLKINSGEMVLVLGGSGAGKTTFMNAVMGYEKAEGLIMYGEEDVYENFESMKNKIGFVPQQDLLRENDTVYNTLENSAQMKLTGDVLKEKKDYLIEKVLETLGLQREKYSLVSKLSGGQRKRLSIAVEYIANPSLFFLDEPDSGLDGIMAKSLMENLRNIADEGKIVMVISHSPDRVADLFDKVIVLAKREADNCGYLAFYGGVKKAYSFFGTNSLEGIVKCINRKDEGGEGLSDYFINKYYKLTDC